MSSNRNTTLNIINLAYTIVKHITPSSPLLIYIIEDYECLHKLFGAKHTHTHFNILNVYSACS